MDIPSPVISQSSEQIASMPEVAAGVPSQPDSTAPEAMTNGAPGASTRRGAAERSVGSRSSNSSKRAGDDQQVVGGDGSILEVPSAPKDLRAAPSAERLSDRQEQLRSSAVTEVQTVKSALADASKQYDQTLAEVAASLALLAVRVGDDLELLAAIFQSFSNRPLQRPEKDDPMLALAQILLAGARHVNRRTPVRAAARAVLAHMRETGWSAERIATDSDAKAAMAEWITNKGGITGLHAQQRARATGREGAPQPVSLTVSGGAGQALRDRFGVNQAGLVLVFRDDKGRLRTVVQDGGSVEVLPPEGMTAAKAARDYGGEVLNGEGGQLMRLTASTKVLVALAEGRLRFPGARAKAAAPTGRNRSVTSFSTEQTS